MVNQLLFYEQAKAVSSERHRDWAIERVGFAFSRNTNSVPLTAVEFSKAAREYPIVFASGDGDPIPLAILGLKDKENLFIAEDGDWNAEYIPAFVRRFPFVFASSQDGSTFTLCIDEGFAGCNQEGRGERLFDDEGTKSAYLERVLSFLREYQAHHQMTRNFCRQLKTLDVLEPMQASVTMGTGENLSLTGFSVVNRDRLKAMNGEQLQDLIRQDVLELIFTHLSSLNNFASMTDRLAR